MVVRSLTGMPPGCLPLEVFQARPPGRRPGADLECWMHYISWLAWDGLRTPGMGWRKSLGRGLSGLLRHSYCHCDPNLD